MRIVTVVKPRGRRARVVIVLATAGLLPGLVGTAGAAPILQLGPLHHLTDRLDQQGAKSIACGPNVSPSHGTCVMSIQHVGDDGLGDDVWTVRDGVPRELTAELGDHDYDAVTCPTASQCVLAGTADEAAGSVQWLVDGHATTTETVSGATILDGISCVSATTCLAVGYVDTMYGAKGVAAVIHPGASTTAATVVSQTVVLMAVSCPRWTRCYAVGRSGTRSEFVQIDKGRVATPVAGQRTHTGFVDVACPSSTRCVAAGQDTSHRKSAGYYIEVIKNGKAGPVHKTPTAFAIGCITIHRCFTVGTGVHDGRIEGVVAEINNGISTGAIYRDVSGYNDISCPRPHSCLLLGATAERALPGTAILTS